MLKASFNTDQPLPVPGFTAYTVWVISIEWLIGR